jgi:hypothetical protein
MSTKIDVTVTRARTRTVQALEKLRRAGRSQADARRPLWGGQTPCLNDELPEWSTEVALGNRSPQEVLDLLNRLETRFAGNNKISQALVDAEKTIRNAT